MNCSISGASHNPVLTSQMAGPSLLSKFFSPNPSLPHLGIPWRPILASSPRRFLPSLLHGLLALPCHPFSMVSQPHQYVQQPSDCCISPSPVLRSVLTHCLGRGLNCGGNGWLCRGRLGGGDRLDGGRRVWDPGSFVSAFHTFKFSDLFWRDLIILVRRGWGGYVRKRLRDIHLSGGFAPLVMAMGWRRPRATRRPNYAGGWRRRWPNQFGSFCGGGPVCGPF